MSSACNELPPPPRRVMPSSPPPSIPVRDEDKYDAIIAGAGPGGLMTAIILALLGKKVLIFSNRSIDQSVRGQQVFIQDPPEDKGILRTIGIEGISEDLRRYLMCLLRQEVVRPEDAPDRADKKFLLELLSNTTVGIKDLERYLKRRADFLSKSTSRITFLSNLDLKMIDLEKGILHLGVAERVLKVQQDESKKAKEEVKSVESPVTAYRFQCYVAADGAGHHSVNVFNQNNPVINYLPGSRPRHKWHASMKLIVERKDGADLELPGKRQFIGFLSNTWSAKKSYLNAVSLEITAKSFNKKRVKCTFGGEVPRKLYNDIKDMGEEKKEHVVAKTTEYMRIALQAYFTSIGINVGAELIVKLRGPSRKHGVAKDKLRLLAFTVDVQKADKVVVEQNGNLFFLVGDNVRTANYQQGHGANHAMIHPQMIGQVIAGKMPLEQYTKACKLLYTPVGTVTSRVNIGGTTIGKRSLVYGVEEKSEELRAALESNPEYSRICAVLRVRLLAEEKLVAVAAMASEAAAMTSTASAMVDGSVGDTKTEKMEGKKGDQPTLVVSAARVASAVDRALLPASATPLPSVSASSSVRSVTPVVSSTALSTLVLISRIGISESKSAASTVLRPSASPSPNVRSATSVVHSAASSSSVPASSTASEIKRAAISVSEMHELQIERKAKSMCEVILVWVRKVILVENVSLERANYAAKIGNEFNKLLRPAGSISKIRNYRLAQELLIGALCDSGSTLAMVLNRPLNASQASSSMFSFTIFSTSLTAYKELENHCHARIREFKTFAELANSLGLKK